MKPKLDCHQILAGRAKHGGYLQALNVDDAKDQQLREARDLIRERLRAGLANWSNLILQRELFEKSFVLLGSTVPALRPRFRMQGSVVYRTLNEPAHIPPQHIDLDDGLYVPTSFVTFGNELRPAIASRGFFLAVEKILEPLCLEQDWRLDRSKATCVRIVIGNYAHIDLPLYAIPDDEFQTLEDSVAIMAAADSLEKSAVASSELADAVYRRLLAERIMLAHREEGWKQSDPRKLEDWVREALNDHGEVLRRIWRYLKGWRDYQWQNGPLSSIALMVVAVQALDDLRGTLPEGRDDVALLEVTRALPTLFQRRIECPVTGLPALDESWTSEKRGEIVERAQHLYEEINEALHGGFHKKVALQRLANVFGGRIPSNELLITVNDEEAEVLSYEPVRVSSPMVTRTASG